MGDVLPWNERDYQSRSVGRYLSGGAPYVTRMTQMESALTNAPIVAAFGTGELVQITKGRLALRGGTPTDYADAREWVSIFMPEAIVESPGLSNWRSM
jgi:hypothetical protein